MTELHAPSSYQEAARLLRDAAEQGRGVRFSGSRTKFGWGRPVDADLELSSAGLGGILEYNHADLTAVLQSGVKLADAHAAFAERNQMLSLDPPPGEGGAATIGGIVATGDSGPLRHRYGGPRDLLLGLRAALPSGTVAGAGGQVIKNVAGYDLMKLFTGAFGTLGFACQVAVRLHPIPQARITALGESDDPDALQAAAIAVARTPLEIESLDVRWEGATGTLAARLSGAAAEGQVGEVVSLMESKGLEGRGEEDDAPFWEEQRSRQRSPGGVVLRVSSLPSGLAHVLRVARRAEATLVGRAALGVSWLALGGSGAHEPVQSIEEVRSNLDAAAAVVLDAPREVREKVDVWGDESELPVELMRKVKQRFDPAGVCNPGIYMGGI